MGELAKMLIFLGVALVVAGVALLLFQKPPFSGKLPGDIFIKRENFTLYVPLATSIAISVLISLILYLFNKFR